MLQERTEDPIALAREKRSVYTILYSLEVFLKERNEEIHVLVPAARTVSAMAASYKFQRRPLSAHSL